MWIFESYDILYYLHNDIIDIYIKDKDSNPESKPELETDEAEDIVDNKEQTFDIKNFTNSNGLLLFVNYSIVSKTYEIMCTCILSFFYVCC